MTKESEFNQLSKEWFDLRIAKITGSHFKDIMPSAKARAEWTKGQLSYLIEVASQSLTGVKPETFSSTAMEWGVDHEEEAIDLFRFVSDKEVRNCGFFEDDTIPNCGSSPDGIGEDFTLEIKCPMSKTHMGYLLDSDELWEEYKWQCIGEALFAEKDTCYLCSYDPRFPEGKQLVVIKKDNLEEDKAALRARLLSANELIDSWIK